MNPKVAMAWGVIKLVLLVEIIAAECLAVWHRDWVQAIFWVLLLISVSPDPKQSNKLGASA
jgi:hypothetical protein